MEFLGLGHYSRTGKDTLANELIARLGRLGVKAVKAPFARKLKEIAHDLYGWAGLREPDFYDTQEGERLRTQKLSALGKSPVEIWVALGTPAIRDQVYDRTWIDYVLRRQYQADLVIVTDVRFPNEVNALRERGATFVKVVRPGYGPKNTLADRALVGYGDWHYVIGGSGQLAELQEWAGRFASWYAGGVRPIQTSEERAEAIAVEGSANRLLDALKRLEWSCRHPMDRTLMQCPACRKPQKSGEHAPECFIGQALSAVAVDGA